ncbi:TolC family protein [Sphingomonas solaris]|uniref:TolC family protein n=1 Tax=Alterirhizorhabdus solaris TaxID=2529389 RepID=A0A558R845_9SPHN|nr:TolC family protein [Sphingomonas solaris]TVV75472.1 TolC family protein [Sphingomonas solaris]
MKSIIAALLAATVCAAAPAQVPPLPELDDAIPQGPSFTLDQAMLQADDSSPARGLAEAGLRGAVAGRRVAGLRPNPSIGIASENFAGNGQYRGFDSAETTVSVDVPIELGGKRGARMALAGALAHRAQVDAAVARADMRLMVAQAYIAAIAAERRLAAARTQSVIATQTEKAARVRVSAGEASPIDDQRADLLRINAEADVEKLERLALTARGNLARLLGRPVAGAFDLAWFHHFEPAGPARPIDAEGTLALAAATADSETAEAQVRLARSLRVPDLAIGAGARRLAQTNDTVAVVSLSLPIPVRTSGTAAIAQASAERDKAVAQRRLALIQAEQAIADVQAEVANAATTARTANGPAIAVAREAARIARIGYREGKFDQTALLDVERSLTETRLAAVDALAAYHEARARLDRLTAAVPVETSR